MNPSLPRVVLASWLAAAALALGAGPAAAQGGPPITFELPLKCVLGEDCWVANYVDTDPGTGAADFNCGPRSYDGHTGTDFMIRDLAVMAAGVPVLAAADGVVAGYRDGMDDVDYNRADPGSLDKRECGNSIGIQHGNGWLTRYCHMRKGSVTVRDGDRVRAGDVIGLVGLSGKTEFPHVHFTVRRGRDAIDPFAGVGAKPRCGMGSAPLWSATVLAKLAYVPAVLYNSGFSGGPVNWNALKAGLVPLSDISRYVPILTLWVEALGVREGDELLFNVVNPAGRTIVRHTSKLERTQARIYRHISVRVDERRAWPEGVYLGVVELRRQGSGEPVSIKLERTARLR
jgi:murein DD-endopeptidase MepM/ murein hydrolase activator NlpD